MSPQLSTRRADRPWPLVLLATATWAQPWFLIDSSVTPWLAALWWAALTLTALPLLTTDAAVFRRACLAVAGLVFVAEAAVSVPYFLVPLPFLLGIFPAAALLLLAGLRRRGALRAVLTALLLVIPCFLAFGELTRHLHGA